MSGPYIIQTEERSHPFQPAERTPTWVGDGHVVQHAALAFAFGDQIEADAVAARFGHAVVLDANALHVVGLDTLAIIACATHDAYLAYMNAPSAERHEAMCRWVRAVSIPDERCPQGCTEARAPMWAVCEDGEQGAGHEQPPTSSS